MSTYRSREALQQASQQPVCERHQGNHAALEPVDLTTEQLSYLVTYVT
jgi:hypothetical protein